MSFQSVPCISTGTTLNNRQVYKAFTSCIIPQPNVLVNVTSLLQLFIKVVVLVFSLYKEILKWLSICPKNSRKLPKSFFFYEKSSKRTNESHAMQRSSQDMKNIFRLIRMAQENQRRKTSRENTGQLACFRWKVEKQTWVNAPSLASMKDCLLQINMIGHRTLSRRGLSAETVGFLSNHSIDRARAARPLKVGAKIYTNMHCNRSKTKIIGHIIG